MTFRSDMKVCFKCNESKTLLEYYKHPGTADGLLNKCKECTKSDVKNNRKAKADYYHEYDRVRAKKGSRWKNKPADYATLTSRKWRAQNPEKYEAHTLVNNAIKLGKLIKESCEECGEPKTHGHHPDYSRPLYVRWLCIKHHQKVHGKGVLA